MTIKAYLLLDFCTRTTHIYFLVFSYFIRESTRMSFGSTKDWCLRLCEGKKPTIWAPLVQTCLFERAQQAIMSRDVHCSRTHRCVSCYTRLVPISPSEYIYICVTPFLRRFRLLSSHHLYKKYFDGAVIPCFVVFEYCQVYINSRR